MGPMYGRRARMPEESRQWCETQGRRVKEENTEYLQQLQDDPDLELAIHPRYQSVAQHERFIGDRKRPINFLACQLVALCVAFPFRSIFSVEKVGSKTRHYIETGVGMLLTLFCFGYQIWHLIVQSMVSYAVMAYGGRRFSHALVFAFSMIYLSVCHIYRQVYDYGGYTLDITGPLMIQTQKLTSLAFALHDGRYKDQSQLSADQKQHAVSKLPSMLQYLSFMFYFHGIMASGSRKHPAEDLNVS
ncbi:lysophospholipid acyltransferase 2 [Elysia marginata]|uniref:Lysophospholipid acyltransferase 2 n=1 Tax=Elysia marginata TaxID=1093978 RepID=A0AAV4J709_9GAST|nr:lysophospholipid acyltransferase 2 [Elysia marginata]